MQHRCGCLVQIGRPDPEDTSPLAEQGRQMVRKAWEETDAILRVAQELKWAETAALDCRWAEFDRHIASAVAGARAVRRVEVREARA